MGRNQIGSDYSNAVRALRRALTRTGVHSGSSSSLSDW
jgi:hypothetical protein